MIMIEPVSAQNILIYRDVRLCALQDTPGAFGSTYAREVQLTDADWMERSKRWDGVTGVLYLGMDSGVACGMAGSFLSPEDETRAQLISMWTAPSHRKQGVGRLLVNEILRWAAQRGGRILQLMVTSVNPTAIQFYKSLGFAFTGRTEPYPNDPAVIEYEMARKIGS
jgi:ribosomal protein S18 acetylase RimI-like enzyme